MFIGVVPATDFVKRATSIRMTQRGYISVDKVRQILPLQPWATFGPTIMLSSLIIGINLFADALAKALGLDRSQGAPL